MNLIQPIKQCMLMTGILLKMSEHAALDVLGITLIMLMEITTGTNKQLHLADLVPILMNHKQITLPIILTQLTLCGLAKPKPTVPVENGLAMAPIGMKQWC